VALLAASGLGCLGVALAASPGGQSMPPSVPLTRPDSVVFQPVPAAVGRGKAAKVMPAAMPVQLEIPAIGVSTQLLRLGLTPSGALATPPAGPHYDRAGWYVGSPAPGAQGPAVIVGHVDSAANGPSVFYRLASLQPGDVALVSRADGTVARFAVDRVLRFPKASFPTQLVYGDTNIAALRLITCGGPFDRATGHYRDNTIVLAHLL
jgi:sortase (surface protein transpeptidase)